MTRRSTTTGTAVTWLLNEVSRAALRQFSQLSIQQGGFSHYLSSRIKRVLAVTRSAEATAAANGISKALSGTLWISATVYTNGCECTT